MFALLAITFRSFVDELQRELAERGYTDIRPAHGFAFQRLVRGGATGNELAEYLDITRQATSQMIIYLEQQGYVTRQAHPHDKREKLIALTDKGLDCTRASEEIFAHLELRCAGMLGAERMQTFRIDLYRLALITNNGSIPARLRPTW